VASGIFFSIPSLPSRRHGTPHFCALLVLFFPGSRAPPAFLTQERALPAPHRQRRDAGVPSRKHPPQRTLANLEQALEGKPGATRSFELEGDLIIHNSVEPMLALFNLMEGNASPRREEDVWTTRFY